MNNSTSYIEYVNKIQSFGWIVTDQVKAYKFEELHPFYWYALVTNNRNVVFYVGALYIVTIFGLQRWMRDRPAYHLKMPLFLWNLGLGIFSIVGFIRQIPGLVWVLSQPGGFYNSMCAKVGDIPASFWLLMFVFSKYVELGDTLFIVLRKRPLILLQWSHHIISLTVAWILGPHMEPVARWFSILNYGVHSLCVRHGIKSKSEMYPYFALRAIGVKVPTMIANLITTLQLSQMILGFGINMLSVYYYQRYGCYRHPESIQLFAFVYSTFIILFGKLFYDAVIKRGRMRKESAKKSE